MSLGIIFGVLFGVSESLSLIPGVKANGVFQLIQNILKGALVVDAANKKDD